LDLWTFQVKQRIDKLLVERGLAETRQKAQALIMAGQVLVDERKVEKPGAMVSAEAAVRLLGEPLRYASRGGLKLEGALDTFGIGVEGKVCLDIGASTGGFTDCLLQRGAARVYAVDVGAGQMDWRLRSDARVVLREKLNARYLSPQDIGEPVDFVCVDVSFISATLIVPRLPAVMKPGGEAVMLVKPQFEAGRGQVGKGGIVRDPELQAQAVEKVRAAAQAVGFRPAGVAPSPIAGMEGNQEFLLHLVNHEDTKDTKNH
jgi:23S rRNA (cytidine1920-2'-O)/16S rRNA (cytidine1409-2'-O)-methyltransferase